MSLLLLFDDDEDVSAPLIRGFRGILAHARASRGTGAGVSGGSGVDASTGGGKGIGARARRGRGINAAVKTGKGTLPLCLAMGLAGLWLLLTAS